MFKSKRAFPEIAEMVDRLEKASYHYQYIPNKAGGVALNECWKAFGAAVVIADQMGWDWIGGADSVALVNFHQSGQPPYLAHVKIPTPEQAPTATERYIYPRLQCLVLALESLPVLEDPAEESHSAEELAVILEESPPRLTIELVPKTSWYDNVRSRVPTNTWDTLRWASYEMAKNLCQVCGGQGLQWPVECHEIWSFDEENKIQKLEGLISLCPDCHQVKHFGLACTQGHEDKVERQLMRINGWTRRFMRNYVRQAFALWEERSKVEWTVDISWIEKGIEEGKKILEKSGRRR